MKMKCSYSKLKIAKKYNPNRLLDTILLHQNLKTDADLARALEVNPSVISKIRHSKGRISAALLLDIHEMTNISIRELRNLMGDTKSKYFLFRPSKLN